ncbi:MAG: D-alanyl-D-alanine carboxypeptidase family protein [Acidobacteriota bacterium]|nr:D-alanyl-D-alanine carboxypeptidase family protein [Acidobacteriota bacterium]
MKDFHGHLILFFVVLAAFSLAVSFDPRPGHGQSREGLKTVRPGAGGSKVQPTSAVREKPAGASRESSPVTSLRLAAPRNASLRLELNWTFGGKQQRGWHIYEALIGRLLQTEHNAASEGFAAALTSWQKRSGLRPTGVLDEESLNEMVSEWQGKRLKKRGHPPPEDLVTAPASDFYDPTRADGLRQVERKTYAAYKRLVATAVADRSLGLARSSKGELAPTEKYLKIISAFRSREYQEKLRRESPNAGRAGLAINSPHFTGSALDLYVGGQPVETKDSNRALQVQTRVYQWLVRNADRFGFRPYYFEPWHWEFVE